MLSGVAGSRALAAVAAAAGLALAGAGCGSSGGTLHTTPSQDATRHGSHGAASGATAKSGSGSEADEANHPANRHPSAVIPLSGRSPQVERTRRATEQQVTQVLQATGASPTQISCITRQIDAMSEVRFQTIISSPDRARATLRAMEARCAG